MKKTIQKIIFTSLSLGALVFSFLISPLQVYADGIDIQEVDTGLGNRDLIDIIGTIINIGLGFLGVIVVCVLLYGGFLWMTSKGEEEKITKAKNIIKNSVIGLAIVLSSWAIAYFIISNLLDATGANGGGLSSAPGSYSYSSGNPFMIDHTNPSDNETDVSLCHLVSVTFSLPLQQNSIAENTFKVTLKDAEIGSDGACQADSECKSAKCENNVCVGDQIEGSYAFSEEPSYTAVWYPNEDYLASQTYKVELTTSVIGVDEVTIDTYNLDLGDPKRVFTFTTGTTTDDIPPKVDLGNLSPYPTDEEQDVCRNTSIQVTFSESIDPASVTDSNVRLYNYTDSSTVVSDELDVDAIKFSSIGGQSDDTIITGPEITLAEKANYGISLYSGVYDSAIEKVNQNFAGGIKDTCGNPLSGNFDDNMEGSPADDFTESTNAAFDEHGWDDQWTFMTGSEVNCMPNVESISYNPAPAFYSEDNIVYNNEKDDEGAAGDEDSDLVLIEGDYLYPFYDVEFYNSISAAGQTCFNQNHEEDSSCFVSHEGSQKLVVRTPAGVRNGGSIEVENENGSSASVDSFEVDSPFVHYLSPEQGPVNQFITIKGNDFRDYDPTDSTSTRGKVYFDGIEAEFPCEDGWDDKEIIVKVPAGFNVDDNIKVQVVTVENRYSNRKGFPITDGEPGPGLCMLDPGCSNTGADNVYIIGQNFGDDEGVVSFADSNAGYTANISTWNGVYSNASSAYDSYKMVVTNAMPITVQNDYDVVVGVKNEDDEYDYSNSLDFELPCREAPELFSYSTCDLQDVFYLPNPKRFSEEACSNGVIKLAFTEDMDQDGSNGLGSIDDLIQVKQCNIGEDYLSTECSDTAVIGDWSSGFLGSSYTDETDYEYFTFEPSINLTAGAWYSVYVSEAFNTELDAIALDQSYSWHFKVKEGDECSVDKVDLQPSTQKVTTYDSADKSPNNYTEESTGDEYTYLAEAYNDECFILNNNFDWHWEINNYTNTNIIQFTNDSETTNGYNNVDLQGVGADNYGTAYVTAGPAIGSYPAISADGINYEESDPAWVNDMAKLKVDYGYCESNDDCEITDCKSECDLTTSHCIPKITGINPEEASINGCITISGCFFGEEREENGSCTCTSTDEDGLESTCEMSEGRSYCLLDTGGTCDLGETCSATTSTYVQGGVGAVKLDDTEVNYLNETLCSDNTWQDDEVIVEIPDTLSTNDSYSVSLTSYHDLIYTYSEQLTLNDSASPCLCFADPDSGKENKEISLYGKNFDTLNSTYRKTQFSDFDESIFSDISNLETLDSTIYDDNAYRATTTVARGATTNNPNETGEDDSSNGVRLTDESVNSNIIDFEVSCDVNSDCLSHCCVSDVCAEEGACNACVDKTDCSYGNCDSDCNDGMCEPYVISVTPSSGSEGQAITVDGCHFGSYFEYQDDSNPYSKVTLNDIEAEFACDEVETWNNEEIKVLAPDGVFVASDEAEINVTQVYEDSNGNLYSQLSRTNKAYCTNSADECDSQEACEDELCDSEWNDVTYTKDDSCIEMDTPSLCYLSTAYANNGDTIGSVEGYSFYGNAAESYCTCETDYSSCNIAKESNSCEATYINTCYADPDDEEVVCSTLLSGTNEGKNYYDATLKKCICVDPETELECEIDLDDGANNSNSCEIENIETCYVDGYEDDDTIVCDSSNDNYVTIQGNVSFANNEDASWTSFSDGGDSYDKYNSVIVPDEAESGDLYVQSIEEDGTVCESNALNFDVACGSCSDCGDESETMCDLTYADGFGICTSDKEGFCEDEPDSCCGNTGCKVSISETCSIDADEDEVNDTCDDENGCYCESEDTGDYCYITKGYDSCDITDGGTCEERPLLEESAPADDDTEVCTNAEITLTFDTEVTTSDVEGIEDDPVYSDYVKLTKNIPANLVEFYNEENYLESVEKYTDDTLLLTQDGLLAKETSYYIVVYSDKENNIGLVDSDNYVALGCTDEQELDSMCTEDGNFIIIGFETNDEANGCPPDYVELKGEDSDFISASYTFISEEEEQDFVAQVYNNGEDEIEGNDDDQAIVGIEGSLDWDYEWSPTYASLEDMDAAECPIIGIVTEADYGYCDCALGECYKTQDEEACTVDNGSSTCNISTGETCYYEQTACDDASGCTCTLDTGEICSLSQGEEDCEATIGPGTTETCYYGETCTNEAGCDCTISQESCYVTYGQTSCDLEYRDYSIVLATEEGTCDRDNENYTEDNIDSDQKCSVIYEEGSEDLETCLTDSGETCTLATACGPDNEDYTEGNFVENQNSQTVTAGSQEGEAWVTVTIIGDELEGDNWTGEVSASKFVRVLFCASAEYISSYYDDTYNTYPLYQQNFSFAYCRGDDTDNLLPDLEDPTIARGSTISEDSLLQYIFTNSDSEDLIGIKVYNNGLDGNDATIYDVVEPGLWADLRLDNFGSYTETTVDGYEAVENDYNVLISAPNLGASGTLYPNIYMLSISKDASSDMQSVFEKIKENLNLNTNSEFAPVPEEGASYENLGCQEKKDKLTRDSKRLTDIGSMNYYLAKYKYTDSDGDGEENYPDVNEGSYIQHITNSIWSSWDSVLGNDLGRSLYTDPYNEFDELNELNDPDEATCPFDEEKEYYYDTEGTCWDPVNKDYYCYGDEGESYLYQYVYNNDDGSYDLYTNLELDDESWDWDNDSTHNPCAGNEYSERGCSCFDYKVSSGFVDRFYYGTCNTSTNLCNSDSGFKVDDTCESDTDCQVIE